MEKHHPSTLARALGALVIVVTSSVVSTSCSGRPQPAVGENSAEPELLVALDLSGSDRPALPSHVRVLAKCLPRLPPGASLEVVGFDSRIALLRTGAAPRSSDLLQAEIVSVLGKWPRAKAGTRFGDLLPDLAQRASRRAGKVSVLIESDMIPDSVTEADVRRMRAAAARLAANPRVVSVAIVGADPRSSAFVERAFGPLVGKKLARHNLEAVDVEEIAGGLR